MKVRKFTPETAPKSGRGQNGAATITFNASGPISISAKLAQMLNLAHGSKVALMQDEENEEDWFVCAAADGFELRDDTAKRNLLFNHAGLAKTIIAHCPDHGGKSRLVTCNVSNEKNEEADGFFINLVKPLRSSPAKK